MKDEKRMKVIRFAIWIGVLALFLAGFLIFASSAGFARSCKDYSSDYGGGLHRTVKVYDIDGDLVAEYTGKFDVETDNETYILWDDEMGKRHIIYFSTFNVIIDEI